MTRGEIKNELKLKKFLRTTSLRRDISLCSEIEKHTEYLYTQSFSERVYHILHDIFGDVICSNTNCNNKCKFISFNEGYMKYCSVKCSNSCKVKINTTKERNIIKYGVTNPMKTDEIKEKSRKTFINHHGCDLGKCKEIMNKMVNTKFLKTEEEKIELSRRTKETCLKKYGVENPQQNIKIREKTKRTNLDKYGKEYSICSTTVKEKIKIIIKEKYGVENVSQNETIRNKIKNIKLEYYFKNILPIYLNNLNFTLLDTEYKGVIKKYKLECKICKTIIEQRIDCIKNGYLCPSCFPRVVGKSLTEKQITSFLKENIKNTIIENSKSIISPKEIDIYIPDLNIAIEYDGLLFHSDDLKFGVDKNYHLNKTNLCKERDIRLIHIFEDEWLFKREIVKNRLLNILGIKKSNRIHARKCSIEEISVQQKDEFLDKFHLQGKDVSTIKLGAFFNEQLVSVMTFSKGNISKGSRSEEGVWELNRFCSDYNYHVPGIAGKLLKHFQRNYEWKQIFSYADRRWSNGNLYNRLGFILEKETNINYWYLKNGKRIHRFNLRKRPDEPKDIPEWVLRQAEGYTSIWDCGNLKFIMENEDYKCR